MGELFEGPDWEAEYAAQSQLPWVLQVYNRTLRMGLEFLGEEQRAMFTERKGCPEVFTLKEPKQINLMGVLAQWRLRREAYPWFRKLRSKLVGDPYLDKPVPIGHDLLIAVTEIAGHTVLAWKWTGHETGLPEPQRWWLTEFSSYRASQLHTDTGLAERGNWQCFLMEGPVGTGRKLIRHMSYF